MGFFHYDQAAKRTKGPSLELLHKHGCTVCPLNRIKHNKHPHMEPYGAKRPLIYMLGEAPGKQEDQEGIPFVGPSGQFLHSHIPTELEEHIRWNNCVRTRPPGNRDPEDIELECCRPSIVKDIEESQPKAIFGFGNVPLYWSTKQTGITKWAGRRIPIKVGNNDYWFFPLTHPASVLHAQNDENKDARSIEFMFALNMHRALTTVDEIDTLPAPFVHTRDYAMEGIEWVLGEHQDLARIQYFLRQASKCNIAGVDYETHNLRPYHSDSLLLTASVSTKHGTLAFPIDHPKARWSDNDRAGVREAFRDFLLNSECRKVAHSLAFEMEWSGVEFGREVLRAGLWGDSQSQPYLYDSRSGCHSLEFLCIENFGINVKAISGIDTTKILSYPLEEVLPYNGLDSKYCRLLYMVQAWRIRDEDLTEVYKHQMRRIPTLVLTQMKGVPIDQEVVKGFYSEYETKMKKIEAEIAELECVAIFKQQKKEAFRPSSNLDVKYVVINILRYNVANVDEIALSPIDHPFCKLILEYRSAAKMLSTYVKPYRAGIDPETNKAYSNDIYPDGNIHPIISTTKVRTWRTSSDSPNAQNQPKHGDDRKLRKQGAARRDKRNIKVVAFDYAGIQARNVAMESKDKVLIDAFWNRYDIHSDWRDRLVRIYPQWIKEGVKALKDKDIAKAYRHRAKNEFVFASFFGAQPPKLASHLGVPETIARTLADEFWDVFGGIKGWHDYQKDFYLENGYITGLSGFRRYAPVSPPEQINTPIQSDESVIVMDAMNRLSEMEDARFQANLMIHDDLTFFWPKDEIDRNAEVVLHEMLTLSFPWINTPLEVEMSIGDNWCDLKEVGKFESITSGGYREIK